MGLSSMTGGKTCTQESLTVLSLTTRYQFTCGDKVALTVTFNSPLIPTDWELLSRPAHYMTFDVEAIGNSSPSVQIYTDFSGQFVMNNPKASMAWKRFSLTPSNATASSAASADAAGAGAAGPKLTALRLGAAKQNPVSSTDDRPSWGQLYLVADAGLSRTSVDYANNTRGAFLATGQLPHGGDVDNPSSPAPLSLVLGAPVQTGPQPGVDRPGSDMPGFPVKLGSVDACWSLCNQVSERETRNRTDSQWNISLHFFSLL